MLNPLSLEEFSARTGIQSGEFFHDWSSTVNIVSLRNLHVEELRIMPKEYLRRLIWSISVVGDESVHPFEGCEIDEIQVDPTLLKIAQTFVDRKKYTSLLEGFTTLFRKFASGYGISRSTSLIAHGKDLDGRPAIAHYIPPIIEENGEMRLLDGIHRNYITMRVGATISSLVIRAVTAPFPCTPQLWSSIKVVDEKPPREERFFDLKPDLFRNLERVGIDG